MDISFYQQQQYPDPPCWALVALAYQRELGRGVDNYKTINTSIRAIAAAFRLALHKSPDGFEQIAEPQDLCIVLMGKTARLGMHHAGVYYQGRVLHALASGVYFQDMASMGDNYGLMEFWAAS